MRHFRLEIDPSFQTIQKNDFITNIRYDRESNSLILIHELAIVDVKNISGNEKSPSFKFESNVYDAMIVKNALITSNKNMPIRIYKMTEQNVFEQFGNSIYDRKPNSQMFLTPLQFAKNNERLVGGGKKFMSEYDLTKLVAKRFKEMNKKYISSIQLMANLAVTGSFSGQITLLDLNSGEIVLETKPHMDLVTKIKRFNTNDYNFLTLARKDNLSYLWDIRNMNSFVRYFEHQLYGNQRTGLDLSQDDRFLYIGSQHGNVFVHSLQQSHTLDQQVSLGLDKCVSSICCVNEEFLCAVGNRQFPIQNQEMSGGTVFTLRVGFQ